jgi:hypothetical protein
MFQRMDLACDKAAAIINLFSSLPHDRSKSLFQSELFTYCDLELPPSDVSILSFP